MQIVHAGSEKTSLNVSNISNEFETTHWAEMDINWLIFWDCDLSSKFKIVNYEHELLNLICVKWTLS